MRCPLDIVLLARVKFYTLHIHILLFGSIYIYIYMEPKSNGEVQLDGRVNEIIRGLVEAV